MIEVEHLTKRFGSTLAVDDLSFTVRPGAVTGFLGPNGAGKTTTLRTLLGLVYPTSGGATIGGQRYRQLERPIREVGAVLEASDFHPGRSGRNHLRVLASAARLPRSRVDEVLALVDLADAAGRRVRGYSLGMRQRLALAAALLGDPDVLVLDEPANGLDPQGIRWLRDFLRARAADGGTVLVSSHLLTEMEHMADAVVIIHRGRFVTQSPVRELASRVGGAVRVRSPEADRLAQVLAEAGVDARPVGDGMLEALGTSSERVGELAAAHGIVLHELTQESASLEQIFLELTTEAPP